MAHPFNPRYGLVVVPVTLQGPHREVTVQLALDTGATATVINRRSLQYVGSQVDKEGKPAEITTGSGIEIALEIRLNEIQALGKATYGFPVLCHTLPANATVDGVLGLDFLRGERLVIDFRAGLLALELMAYAHPDHWRRTGVSDCLAVGAAGA